MRNNGGKPDRIVTTSHSYGIFLLRIDNIVFHPV